MKGDVIGQAQDITVKYPNQGMTPHVHMGVELNPEVLYNRKGKLWMNPQVIGVSDA